MTMSTVKTPQDKNYEGHGEPSKAPNVRKGEYMQVGTVAELAERPTSVNQKTPVAEHGAGETI
jgi:hypothetical protein